jgi:hypothetical protein
MLLPQMALQFFYPAITLSPVVSAEWDSAMVSNLEVDVAEVSLEIA